MPFAGDEVTVTVAPGGRAVASSRALDRGISSNFGAATRAARAPRWSGRGRGGGGGPLAQASASGIDALRWAMNASSASSIAGSRGGSW